MNRLFRVLHRWKCTTAAQKSALDALRCLGDDATRCSGLLLWNVEDYFRGVNAPERDFRDAANQVHYVRENWGGAVRLSRKWYWTTVEALRSRDWAAAAYAAGVMVRYASCACSPLRTAHSDRAIGLCRPVEWCLSRHYDELLPDLSEARPAQRTTGEDWLERLLTDQAEAIHRHHETIVERFDLETLDEFGRRPEALGDELRTIFAEQLSRTAATLGAILTQAIVEADAAPPRSPIGLAGLLALPSLPLFWMSRQSARRRERRAVRAMAREFRTTGQIERTLPDDARSLREAYDIEVLKKSIRTPEPESSETTAPKKTSTTSSSRHQTARPASVEPPTIPVEPLPVQRTASLRTDRHAGTTTAALMRSSPIADAPSIDARIASKFEAARVRTIGDLLDSDPETLAASLHPHATAADVATWRDEARLCCEVGIISPHESQLLIACGVTGPEDLAALSPVELWELVVPVAESPDGRRLLRGGSPPDLDTVTRWIDAAKQFRAAA